MGLPALFVSDCGSPESDAEIGRGARLIVGMDKILGGADSKVLHFLNVRFAGTPDKIADLSSRQLSREMELRRATVILALRVLVDRKILRRLGGDTKEAARYELAYLVADSAVRKADQPGTKTVQPLVLKADHPGTKNVPPPGTETGPPCTEFALAEERKSDHPGTKTVPPSIKERAPARLDRPTDLNTNTDGPSVSHTDPKSGFEAGTLSRPMVDKALQAAGGERVRSGKPFAMIEAANLKLQLPIEAVARFLLDKAELKLQRRDGPANPGFLAKCFQDEAASWASANQDYVQACVLRVELAGRRAETETHVQSEDAEALRRKTAEFDALLARDKELGMGQVKGKSA